MPVEVLNSFNDTSGTNVAEGYGLSEASPVTHRNPISGIRKAGSIGIPIPNTDAKIVDAITLLFSGCRISTEVSLSKPLLSLKIMRH